MTEVFDFEHEIFKSHTEGTQQLLREGYHSGMTRQEFIDRYTKLPNKDTTKPRYRKSHRTPYHAGRKYDHLQKKFNFF